MMSHLAVLWIKSIPLFACLFLCRNILEGLVSCRWINFKFTPLSWKDFLFILKRRIYEIPRSAVMFFQCSSSTSLFFCNESDVNCKVLFIFYFYKKSSSERTQFTGFVYWNIFLSWRTFEFQLATLIIIVQSLIIKLLSLINNEQRKLKIRQNDKLFYLYKTFIR